MTLKEYEIESAAIKLYGEENQLIVAIEEMSELIKELTKHMRGQDNVESISEELADVSIMLEQIQIIFKNQAAVKVWKEKKLIRLDARLHGSAKNQKLKIRS